MYKPSKYRATPTEFNGIKYHSKKEAIRAKQLDFMLACGVISNLKRQVKYAWIEKHKVDIWSDLEISFKRSYIADFVYFDIEKKIEVVEDVKGFFTAEYKKKKKIVEKIFSIKIVEI